MSTSKPLADRERALEEAFFHRINEKLIAEMRARREHDADFEALAADLGPHDAGIIEPLLDLGVRHENVAALVMAPLVAVAWADRSLDNEERSQLLDDEAHFGIRIDSPAGRLLAAWLEAPPETTLFDTWEAYVHELAKVLPEEQRVRLRDDVVGRAKRLSGALEKTFLRGGGANRAERAVVERIEAAFGNDASPAKPARRSGGLDDFLNSLT